MLAIYVLAGLYMTYGLAIKGCAPLAALLSVFVYIAFIVTLPEFTAVCLVAVLLGALAGKGVG